LESPGGNKKLIGYVYSSYARHPLTEVKQDIDKWINYYPKIQGIFIDEQASDGKSVDYYSDLYKHIRKSKGLKLVVANPGTLCAEGFFSSPAADVICLHESDKDVAASFFPAWTGRPLMRASVGWLPLLLATVSVLPVADGRSACRGISMWRALSLMVVFMVGSLVD